MMMMAVSSSTRSLQLARIVTLFLLCPALVNTMAFSSSSVASSLPRGGGGSVARDSSGGSSTSTGYFKSEELRGGARLRRALTSPRRRKLSLRRSSAVSEQEQLVTPSNATTATAVMKPITTTPATGAATADDRGDELQQEKPFLRRIDGIVFVSYLCNVMALSLPVLLVPVAVTEQAIASSLSAKAASVMVASQVASISSVASLGGAVGKFVNGFICKEYGSYFCSKTYLFGLGLCSLAFSLSSNPVAMSVAFAGMEFFASIQWASLAVMLTNYYAKEPVRLAAALTALGLSSSSGQILAKFFGMTLSSAFHWRIVAQVGALVAFGGAAIIARAPGRQAAAAVQKSKPPFQWNSVAESLKAVLGSPLFWLLGLAHSIAFVAKNTDRILGTFFQEMAVLSPSIAGGMTLSITLGLVHGLISGAKKFSKCANLQDKRSFLKKRYITTVLATLGLTCLSQFGAGWVSNRWAISAAIALASSVMASNISFQYFQFPAMIARRYGDHKAVVISFLDGLGFLLSAPIFATIGQVVPTMGWSSGWTMLASMFGGAALLMLAAINPILDLSRTPAEEELELQATGSTGTAAPAAA